MNKTTKILALIIFIVLIFAVFYGIRSFRISKIEEELEQPTLVNALLEEPTTADGVTYLIPPNQIYDHGTGVDGIPPINDPVYISVSQADEVLADGIFGIDIEVGGQHRFYSYQIMNWHEVVNDEFNGKKLAITFGTLCRTPVVYEREIDGEELAFGNSGKIYNNNSLFYDQATESLWLQSRGMAISGEKIGTELTPYPSVAMKWGEWKELYPDGEVLSTETGHVRDYTRHPFGTYDEAKIIYFPINHTDNRLTSKWIINGLNLEGGQIAFSRSITKGFGAVNEVLGFQPVVALHDYETEVTRIFSSYHEDQILFFSYDFDTGEITDEVGSVWSPEGLALSGDLEGFQLTQLHAPESFWFCWVANYPETTVSKLDSTGELEPNE